jgi:hypothetical protein
MAWSGMKGVSSGKGMAQDEIWKMKKTPSGLSAISPTRGESTSHEPCFEPTAVRRTKPLPVVGRGFLC